MKKYLLLYILIIPFICKASVITDFKHAIDVALMNNPSNFINEPLVGLYDVDIKLTQYAYLGPKVSTFHTKAIIKTLDEPGFDYYLSLLDPKTQNFYDIETNIFGPFIYRIKRIGDTNAYTFEFFSDILEMPTLRVVMNDYGSFSFTTGLTDLYMSFLGGVISGTRVVLQLNFIKEYPTLTMIQEALENCKPKHEENEIQTDWSGTGFAIGNGYLVTNYHVIENAKSISIQGIKGSFEYSYHAIVSASDKKNDLAILKINDNNFKGFGTIPYRVKSTTSDVGEDVFVLGYPLTATMGEEIKLTTGVISSKTGFQGDVSMYQISAPVQPGSSGGPLFDGKGNIIGVVSAKHLGAENVGYAIKTSYLNNLVETLSGITLPSNNIISTLSLSEKVKRVDDFVFLISCSSKVGSLQAPSSTTNSNYTPKPKTYPKTSRTVYSPSVERTTAQRAKVKRVVLAPDYTAVEITSNNQVANGGYQWCNISKWTYIVADYQNYTMTKAEGIKIAPDKSYFSRVGEEITFTLYFPPLPESIQKIDLIESLDSEWQWYGISLK